VHQAIVPLAQGFIKLSYFLFYMQIFKPHALMRTGIWIGGVACVVYHLCILGFNMALADPGPPRDVSATRKEGRQLAVPASAIGLGLDLYILTLPIFGVWQLQLSRRKKFAVSLIFLTGAVYVFRGTGQACSTANAKTASACVSAMLTLHFRMVLLNTTDILRVMVPVYLTT
jgi:hypothetical protein